MTKAKEQTRGDVTVLSIEGDLDAMFEAEMMARSDALIRAKKIRIVIDVSAVPLIDSAGFGCIVSLFKRARALKGDAKLVGLAGQPREIFTLLRLDRAFDVHPTVESAVKSFGAATA